MSKSHATVFLRPAPSTIVFAAFLTKLAKHLALLACLAIVGAATGRILLSPPSILLLVIGAALINALGQTLKHCAHNRQAAPRDRL